MVFCSHCGTENDDGAVLCKKCHKKLYSNKSNWEVKFVVIVAIFAIGFILYSLFGLFDDMMYISVVSGEDISAYKSSYMDIDLNKPEDNLALLSGQKVKVKGTFMGTDIGSPSDKAIFKLKIANLTYYPYVDITYSSNVPYVEGDELEVYGEYGTFLSYDNVTVPFIKGAYIEKI